MLRKEYILDKEKILSNRLIRWNQLKNSYSYVEIAEKCKVDRSVLHFFINGQGNLKTDQIARISEYVNKSIEWLYGLGEEDVEVDTVVTSNGDLKRHSKEKAYDNGYLKMAFNSIEYVNTAKKLQLLTAGELKEVDGYINYVIYRKKLKKEQ